VEPTTGAVVEPDGVDVAPVLERPRFTRCASSSAVFTSMMYAPAVGMYLAT